MLFTTSSSSADITTSPCKTFGKGRCQKTSPSRLALTIKNNTSAQFSRWYKLVAKADRSSMHSLQFPSAHLYCSLDVDTRVPDSLQQLIETAHLLDKHSVHALSVSGRIPSHRCFSVKIGRKLAQDVTSDFMNNFVTGFCTAARCPRLERIKRGFERGNARE